MKAYVYRSGHVMIGPSIPEGAIEIADWDNEAELIAVLYWEAHMVCASEGPAALVLWHLLGSIGGNERACISHVKHSRVRIAAALHNLRNHPCAESLYTVGPIEKWSPESVEAFQ